jgi:site-specific DNA recombinase
MCLDGKSNETIARTLQENKVLVPMAYWHSKGLSRGGKKTQTNPYKWCKTTIQKNTFTARILRRYYQFQNIFQVI